MCICLYGFVQVKLCSTIHYSQSYRPQNSADIFLSNTLVNKTAQVIKVIFRRSICVNRVIGHFGVEQTVKNLIRIAVLFFKNGNCNLCSASIQFSPILERSSQSRLVWIAYLKLKMGLKRLTGSTLTGIEPPFPLMFRGRNSAETIWLQHESAGKSYFSQSGFLKRGPEKKNIFSNVTAVTISLSFRHRNIELLLDKCQLIMLLCRIMKSWFLRRWRM